MEEIVMNEELTWKTFLKYGISYPLCVILVTASPLVFGPIMLLYILWYKDKYFSKEEVKGV